MSTCSQCMPRQRMQSHLMASSGKPMTMTGSRCTAAATVTIDWMMAHPRLHAGAWEAPSPRTPLRRVQSKGTRKCTGSESLLERTLPSRDFLPALPSRVTSRRCAAWLPGDDAVTTHETVLAARSTTLSLVFGWNLVRGETAQKQKMGRGMVFFVNSATARHRSSLYPMWARYERR